MNTKLLVAFLVVVAIGAGLYFLSPKADAPTTTEEDETSEEAELELDTLEIDSEPQAEAQPVTNTAPTQTAPQTQYIPPTTSELPAALPYSATVIYDGGRFIPDEVTIIVGGTVRFVNMSDTEKMWIAGDNHPKHNIYPIKTETSCSSIIFNQCAAVGRNGSWSFRFDRWGGWGYHNEERPKDNGKIRVLTVEEYEKQI